METQAVENMRALDRSVQPYLSFQMVSLGSMRFNIRMAHALYLGLNLPLLGVVGYAKQPLAITCDIVEWRHKPVSTPYRG